MVEQLFAAPRAIAEMQNKAVDLAFEIADETAKRTGKAIQDAVAQNVELAKKQGEALIDAMNAGEKIRQRISGMAREACHPAKTAAK